MGRYDWSKYRDEIDSGATLWKSTKQIEEDAEYAESTKRIYTQLSEARNRENEAYQASQKLKKDKAQAKITTGKAWTSAISEPKKAYNPAAAMATGLFNKEYVNKNRFEYTKKLTDDYSRVSNYKVNPKIVKQETLTGGLTTKEKFANQFLGVIGNIKNLDKPKTVYQFKGGEVQDPVTKEMRPQIWENVLQLQVVAEDKENYYYRIPTSGKSWWGNIQRVPKDQVKEDLPDLEEQKIKYMEHVVNTRKPTATMVDKIRYNVAQGMGRFMLGSEEKAQIPTGNRALDIATNVGGELLGFASPTGAATSLGGALEQVGNKATAAVGKLAPGFGRAVQKGAIEMGAFSAMEKKDAKESYVRSIFEDMVVGGLFMGTLYGTSKGASKLMKSFKKIPGNPDTENLVKAASDEYKMALDDLNVRDTENFQALKVEAANKFAKDIDEIAARYKKVDDVPFPETVKQPTEIAASKTINESELLGRKTELETKINDLKGMHETATRGEKSVLANQIKQAEDEVANIDLQLLGTNRPTEIQPSNTEIQENLLKTKEHIVSKSDIKPSNESWFGKIYRNIVDRNRGLFTATKKAGATKNLASSNPYKLANMMSTYEGVAKSNIEQGLTDKTGKEVSEGLGAIMKEVPNKKSADIKDYMVLKEAEFLGRVYPEKSQVYPKEWGLKPEDLKTKIKELEQNNPEFKELATRFTKYNNNLVKTQLVDTGLISAEEFNTITKSNPFYTPLKRAFSAVEQGQGFGKGGGSQIRFRKGSERQVIDPMESMIENTFNYAKAAKRNEVASSLYKLIEKDPEALGNMVRMVEKQSFKKPDPGRAFDEGDLTGFIDEFNDAYEIKGINDLSKPNVIPVRINGETRYMEVQDKALLESLTYLDKSQADTLIEKVRTITGAMKTVTTGVNPMFGLGRNIWRDVVTGYVQSKTVSNIPVANYVQYLGDLLGAGLGSTFKTKGYKEYRSLGGGFFSSAIGTEKNMLKETVEKYTGQGLKTKGKKVIGAPIKALEWLNNTLETMPRYAEYNRTLKKLKRAGTDDYSAKMEAIYNGQEVTVNFMRSGKVTKTADAFVPYLNAAVQGIDKTLRTLDPRDPKQLAGVISKGITSITVPSLMLYAVNHENPRYQELSDYIKDNNFLIPIDKKGTFIKIPKPREFGILMGSLPERMAREFADKDPKAWKNFSDAIKQNFTPPFPLTEHIAAPIQRNVNSPEGRTWQGKPVVPQSLLKYSPARQYDESTSAMAKTIGEKMGYSPKKIDELFKNYGGGIAAIGIPLTSDRTKNEKGAISAFVEVLKKQVTADSKYQNDIANEFYSNMEKVNWKKADMEGKLGDEETYIDSATYIYNNVSRQLSDLRKEQKATKDNKEKDRIQIQMNDLMKKTNEDYNKNYTKKKFMESVKRKRKFER